MVRVLLSHGVCAVLLVTMTCMVRMLVLFLCVVLDLVCMVCVGIDLK